MSINYSIFVMRDLLKEKIIDNTIHELLIGHTNKDELFQQFPSKLQNRHLMLRDPNFQFNYHITNLIALQIGKSLYNPIRYINNNEGVNEKASSLTKVYSKDKTENINTDIYLVEVLMQNDLNRVNLFFATVAWLTIDEFRWHNEPGFENVPSDLSYGLVQEYSDLLIPYSMFITNINREENLKLLNTQQLNLINIMAKDSIQK